MKSFKEWLEEYTKLNECPPAPQMAEDVWKYVLVAQTSKKEVAEIKIEPDYWYRGHFFKGHRKQIVSISNLDDFPIGTKLYTTLAAKGL